jgi:hypothetical protein
VLFDFGFLGQADMRFKDKFFACLSLGERTYRTETSDKFSNIFSIVLCAVLCLPAYPGHDLVGSHKPPYCFMLYN